MLIIRSLLFNVLFYSWTFLCAVIFTPILFLPRIYTLKIAHFWIEAVIWLCEHVLHLQFKLVGNESLLKTSSLFAVKHQSFWETFIFYYLLPDPVIALKKELLWIPFFGWYLKKLNMIPLSRSMKRGRQDLTRLLKNAEEAVACKRPILIFPEGTRSKPNQKGVYKAGVGRLYLHLNIPVVPIAHNAGLFWPRRTFVKHPGQITVDIMDPIKPGLSRQEFMHILENKIEEKTKELIQKERPNEIYT